MKEENDDKFMKAVLDSLYPSFEQNPYPDFIAKEESGNQTHCHLHVTDKSKIEELTTTQGAIEPSPLGRRHELPVQGASCPRLQK